MTDSNAKKPSAENSDATRFAAGESDSTRIVPRAFVASDDGTRIALFGDQPKLVSSTVDVPPESGELYNIGDKIGDRYEVAAIHHGAMGVVYGCFDHVTKLPRALKTVRSRYSLDNQVISMFENEAAVWISLEKHPYIVRAYLIQKFNDLPYVITEYVRGTEDIEGDLRGWLGHSQLTLPVAVTMALQIAQGMQHAVRKVPNLVHRDLKPANILVNGDGKAMVTDFGLVDSAQTDAGTPAYMSPEQWRNDTLDARSDIYAYGCVLFEMFTAHRLFPAITESDWKSAHLGFTPAELTTLVPEMPGEIDQFVRRCLEKEVRARPQSWDEVVGFFAEWYYRLTGKAVVLDFSSLELDTAELLSASQSLSGLRRFKEMVALCDRIFAINPNHSEAWYHKALGHWCLKQYNESNNACDQLLSLGHYQYKAWGIKGYVLGHLNRYEEAILSFKQAIEIDPSRDIFCCWEGIGKALLKLHRYDEAYQVITHALELDGKNQKALLNKGLILYKLKKYDEAIQAYDNLLEVYPTFFSAPQIKGKILIELKRFDEANQAFDQVLAIDPSHIDTLLSKGNVLFALKRYDEANQAYDQCLSLDANYILALNNKISVLFQLKQYDKLLLACDRVISINPKSAISWQFRGIALTDLKRFEEAIQSYDRVLEIIPDDAYALQEKNIIIESMAYVDAMKPKQKSKSFWGRFFGK